MKRLQLDQYSRIGDFQLIDQGDPALDLFNESAHRFAVLYPAAPGTSPDLGALQRVIDGGKPAHTGYDITVMNMGFRIGVQSAIGVGTLIAGYPASGALGSLRLGRSTVGGVARGEKGSPIGAARIGQSTRVV